MKNFYKTIKCLAAAATAFIASISISCTDVDKSIGIDFVPDEELSSIMVDTLYPNVYNITLDSLLSTGLTSNFIGSYYDPIFGTTTAGTAMQFIPSADSMSFGTTNTVDSIILSFTINNRYGDDNYDQTLRVYELAKYIAYDSSYYPTMPLTGLVKPTEIGSYTFRHKKADKWDTSAADTIFFKLDNSLGEKLVSATDETMIKDTLFYNFFNGLYITTDKVSPGNSGRMNKLSSSAVVMLYLYFKRDGKDTTYSYYNSSSLYNATFTAVQHDYSTVNHPNGIRHMNDTASLVATDSLLYLQGLFGVTPYVKIRKDDIQQWLTNKNININDIVISRAYLEFDVYKDFPEYNMSNYCDSLGLFYKAYFNEIKASTSDTVKKPTLSTINEMSSSIFGGNLNKSLLKYPFKITYDFTALLKQFDTAKGLSFLLSPSMSSYNSYTGATTTYADPTNIYRMILKGTNSSRPPRLIITYTKSLTE